MRATTKLRKLLATGETHLVPGAYDGMSARIVQAAGALLPVHGTMQHVSNAQRQRLLVCVRFCGLAPRRALP